MKLIFSLLFLVVEREKRAMDLKEKRKTLLLLLFGFEGGREWFGSFDEEETERFSRDRERGGRRWWKEIKREERFAFFLCVCERE